MQNSRKTIRFQKLAALGWGKKMYPVLRPIFPTKANQTSVGAKEVKKSLVRLIAKPRAKSLPQEQGPLPQARIMFEKRKFSCAKA